MSANLNWLFEATWSPCAAASKQKNQEYCNSNYWIRAWQHWIKVLGPPRKTSFRWIEVCNWSKNNFGEIQISQGLDWHFPLWHIFVSWPPPSTNDVIWTDREGKVEETRTQHVKKKPIVFWVDRTPCSLVVLTKSQNLAMWQFILKMK